MAHPPSPETRWAWQKGRLFARQGKPLHAMPMSVRQHPELKKWFLEGYHTPEKPLAQSDVGRMTPWKRALWLGLAILAGLATAANMLSQMENTPEPHSQPGQQPPSPTLKSPASTPITPTERAVFPTAMPVHEADDSALHLLSEEALAKQRLSRSPAQEADEPHGP